jgi:glycolate oxidase FAD binding subunit
MTITVQAGITIARLQEILAQENQRLPVDVPLPQRATLGGAIACNASGPRRYGYGTFRDYVIGISVINDRGEEVNAGGRVVKNVAGYDLCKLHVGALGTLGIISQVTLKVRPRPESQALVRLPCPRASLEGLLNQVHASSTRPMCLDVHDEAGDQETLQIFIGYEENTAAVAWQLDRLRAELGQRIELTLHHGDAAASELQMLSDLPLWSASGLTFRASMLPGATAQFVECVRQSAISLAMLHGQAGSGVLYGHLHKSVSKDDARRFVERIRRVAAAQGNLVLTRCPNEWKPELGVWGEPRGDWELMRRVKHRLDPQNIFNPGRFVGGI